MAAMPRQPGQLLQPSGAGAQLRPQRAHELSLRIQHSSNAGIKEPNPGENFLLLRYAHVF
jgi:hypothetical protein